MPRGDKSKYTDRQKRKAQHIEEGYEERGVVEGRSRAARVGHRQQGRRRRQQERIGTRRAGHQSLVAQGRAARRTRERPAAGCGAQALGEKGRGDTQAPGVIAFHLGKTLLWQERAVSDRIRPSGRPEPTTHCES